MSGFAKRSTKQEDVKQSSSNYINSSGIYPITIIVPFVDTSEEGSSVVNLYIEHQGQKQSLFGNMRVTNKNDENGDPVTNTIGMRIFNQLLVIADTDAADPVEAELPIGKKEAMKDVAILEDLQDIEVLIRVQMEYSNWKGIQEKKVIKGFYRLEDGATAEEIVNDSEVGKGIKADENYVDNITYKDDLTPEDIAAWVAGGRGKGGASSGAAKSSSSAASKKAKPAFTKKRFGKKEA